MCESWEEGETHGGVSQADPLPHQEGSGHQNRVQNTQPAQQLLLGP
jgi:hypothetical protein